MREVSSKMTMDEAQDIVNKKQAPKLFAECINDLAQRSHAQSRVSGWWSGKAKVRNVGEMIALMHSELSEALEGARKDTQDEHLPEFLSVEVELADCLHRIFDFAASQGLRLGEAYVAKGEYNGRRADHKPENREKEGGKQF